MNNSANGGGDVTADVVVLGGGPGGSTVAAFVAMQGHRVLLLERERFPRHQIGESLLPATVHGVCRLLGVSERLKQQGFPIKRGGTFRWGRSPEPWTFTFSRAPDSPTGSAYQVERAKFDQILLDNARTHGVDVREEHCATELLVERDSVVGVEFTDDRGGRHCARARYVVDCSGHGGRLHSYCGPRVHSEFFRNVALYGYFENGKRLPPPNSGNILSVAFDEGWFWYIPLSDSLTSVGAVVSREAASEMSEPERALHRYIPRAPLINDFLADARRVTTGIYGQLRIRRDYSYSNGCFWKPGFALVGDAACFIDPVFSSGVHLATYAALLAARSINTCLRDASISERAVFDEFERRYRREFGNFYQFLLAFYDMHSDPHSYFWAARKIVCTPERENIPFVRLVSGLSAVDEALFGGGREFFDSRIGFGAWFEETVQTRAKGSEQPGAATIDLPRFDPKRFMEGFTAEIAQIQLQALFGPRRTPDKPMFSDSPFVPSADGLHWALLTNTRAGE